MNGTRVVISSIPIYSIVRNEPQTFDRKTTPSFPQISRCLLNALLSAHPLINVLLCFSVRSLNHAFPFPPRPTGRLPKGLARRNALISTCSRDMSGCKREAARGKWLNGANLVSSVGTDSKKLSMSFWHNVIIFSRRTKKVNTSVGREKKRRIQLRKNFRLLLTRLISFIRYALHMCRLKRARCISSLKVYTAPFGRNGFN